MIDIHSHIIYGIDDGARDFEESVSMMKMAAYAGTHKMIATTHYLPEIFSYSKETYNKRLSKLNDYCKSYELNLEILPGNELFLTPEGIRDVKEGECRTLNNTRYVLVEISNFMKASKADELLGILANNNNKIILAHAERIRYVLEEIDIIKKWFDDGYVFQINGSSLQNKNNKENYQSAHLLMKYGFVHVIASDGHRKNRRRPKLDDSYNYIQRIIGTKGAQLLFVENPYCIINDKEVVGLEETIFNNNYFVKRVVSKLKGVK